MCHISCEHCVHFSRFFLSPGLTLFFFVCHHSDLEKWIFRDFIDTRYLFFLCHTYVMFIYYFICVCVWYQILLQNVGIGFFELGSIYMSISLALWDKLKTCYLLNHTAYTMLRFIESVCIDLTKQFTWNNIHFQTVELKSTKIQNH